MTPCGEATDADELTAFLSRLTGLPMPEAAALTVAAPGEAARTVTVR